ncbi:MAG: NAD-dependent epimerase/dehydratase family protein [Bdellovibrionota bacterium]
MENNHSHERIAITGANSFLNTLVLKRLSELSTVKEIHIFDMQPPSHMSTKCIFHRLDITKEKSCQSMAQTLLENNVSEFIHGALYSGPTRSRSVHHEVESIGTFHVLNAIAEAKIKRFVVHSSTFVYGAHPQNPNFMNESFITKYQKAHFVRTRVDVENQIKDFSQNYPKCEVIVLRFAPILGPNSTNVRARYFMSGIVPKVFGYDPLLQFIHEDDALRAQIMALFSKATGVFNIVGRGVLPLSTGIHLSGKFPVSIFSGLCKTFFSGGYLMRAWELPSEMVPFFQYLCVADGKKAENELGFVAKYSSRQALKSMIEANRLREIGFSVPSATLGEDEAYATTHGFQKIQF